MSWIIGFPKRDSPSLTEKVNLFSYYGDVGSLACSTEAWLCSQQEPK